MAALARLNLNFHRLALLLAAIPLLLGGSLSVYIAFDLANRLWEQHQKLVCAHEHVAGQKPDENVFDQFDTGTGKKVTVRVNDRGPFTPGVKLDLSSAAARAIGMRSTQNVTMSRC
jgi:hypothetical protein